jgi:3'(2'), 5'-bisphosphate nucleotidase
MNEFLHFQSMLTKLRTVACRAGRTIMRYYEMDRVRSKIKYDGTPVTEADIESERMIISSLKSFSPHIPIISEEQANVQSSTRRLYNRNGTETRTFWLVDPLDGTEAFMRKEDRFTINIGLVQNSKPVLGVVYFPVRDMLYSGISGLRAELQPNASRKVKCKPLQIKTSSCSKGDSLVALADSRISDTSKLDVLLRKVKISNRLVKNNSHKLCGVAIGDIDVSTIMRSFEWDTAAGHAILKGAGGNIIDSNGSELRYGKPEFKNPSLIAHGRIFEYETLGQ